MKFKNNISSSAEDDRSLLQLSPEQEMQILAKRMLVHRLFIGHYQERRYIEALGAYRDVVMVHNTEDKLERDLDIVRERLHSFYEHLNLWIGITGPNMIGAPAGTCVWVQLQNLAFGYYWFQIRHVVFSGGREMCLRLKCMRPVDPELLGPGSSISSASSRQSEEVPPPPPSPKKELPEETTQPGKLDQMRGEMVTNFFSLFTLHNVKEVSSFLTLLVVASITGAVKLVGFLGDFTIKFMREFSGLITAMNPVLIAIVEFFAKCVGGFYLLIAILWRGAPVNFPKNQGFTGHEPSKPMLMYKPIPPPDTYNRRRPKHW